MKLHSRILLLKRYLHRKTTERQNGLIDEWYHSIDDTQEIGLWQEAGKKDAVRGSIQLSLWEFIHKQPHSPGTLFPIPFFGRWVAAASIIAVLLCGYWMLTPSGQPDKPVQYFSVTAALGEIKQIQLPDSSQVWLKSGTTLRYNSTYGEQNRSLELLDGEAFFSVQKDSTRPFIVSTGQLQAKVLGTAFNIQAYNNRPEVQVWVEHGRVQVSNSSKVLQELTKDRRLKWNRRDGNFSLDSLAWGQALAWQKGILLLEAASFTELAFQLKELYGMELITRDTAIRRLHYDAKFFIRTPVENIVATLTEVHGIRYKTEGKTITLYY